MELVECFAECRIDDALPILADRNQYHDMNAIICCAPRARIIDFCLYNRAPIGAEICVTLGADLTIKNGEGNTPYEFGLKEGFDPDSHFMKVLSGNAEPRSLIEIVKHDPIVMNVRNIIQDIKRKKPSHVFR